MHGALIKQERVNRPKKSRFKFFIRLFLYFFSIFDLFFIFSYFLDTLIFVICFLLFHFFETFSRHVVDMRNEIREKWQDSTLGNYAKPRCAAHSYVLWWNCSGCKSVCPVSMWKIVCPGCPQWNSPRWSSPCWNCPGWNFPGWKIHDPLLIYLKEMCRLHLIFRT